jgi:predicted DNA-binding transcriptional regulator YafY
MLASRLLSLLLQLQARGRMTASALAAEFEVSVRTIHRDIDELSAAGIPVFAERGRSGGFRLRDGYRTTLTGLTRSEAETLFLAGLPGPAAELGLAAMLSSARLKLLAALPPDIQHGAERISARFHLDPAGWFRGSDNLASLPTVAKAVWEDRMLSLRYRRAGQDGAATRKVAPLGLVLKGGAWYLVARSGSFLRTYRIANIRKAELCRESFARPRSFDLAAHWREASRDYELGLYREKAVVRLSPGGMRLIGILGPNVESAAKATAGRRDSRGWVRCTVPIESEEAGARELLRLGLEVEVLEPLALRARVADTARRVSEAYDAGWRAI